jgi:hypothetical protein
MEPILKYILIVISAIAVLFFIYFFVGYSTPKKVNWGINYSVKQAEFLGLDPRETYIALLDDLKFRDIKISVHWDLIQPVNLYDYKFEELDWEIREAQARDAKVVLAIGMKTPRWPECHMPQWARSQEKKEQQESVLRMVTAIVERYKNNPTVSGWQVENEVLLKFGACPWIDEKFFRKEVALVKELDPTREVIVTDSGEVSFWMKIASIGDKVGVTTYRKVWQQNFGFYFDYFFPPIFYERRANLVKLFFNKEVIGSELQAEAWCPNSIINASLEEQDRTMSLAHFKENVEFAKKIGFNKFYLWGGEWWYWLKVTHDKPEIWNEAKAMMSEESN